MRFKDIDMIPNGYAIIQGDIARNGEQIKDPKSFVKGSQAIIDMLNGLPDVDAVHVVRCKDCKHRRTHASGDFVYHECEHLHFKSVNVGLTDNWFCADGERKEWSNERLD